MENLSLHLWGLEPLYWQLALSIFFSPCFAPDMVDLETDGTTFSVWARASRVDGDIQ